jgi:uncharacterized protein (DUF924 family)
MTKEMRSEMKTHLSVDLEAALAGASSTAVPPAQMVLPRDQWTLLANATLESTPRPTAEAQAVVDFWHEAGPTRWFAKDETFDRRFRKSFLSLYQRAAHPKLVLWPAAPISALALVLLLDQFPRNAFRGTPRMYATDVIARKVARAAIAAGHDRVVHEALQLFFYLPFGHSEDLADQERSVALNRRLGQPHMSHAERHRDIVRRFGRFPHRNPILGRTMTQDEQRFLDEGGFAG